MSFESRWHLAAATAVGAASVSTWFMVGQLAEEGGTDYLFRVPQLNRRVEVIVGLVAAVVAAEAVVLVWWNGYDQLVRRGWWRVYGRLLAVGVLCAVGGRIVTAAAGGANIGGGMILMFGPVPILYLLARAGEESCRLQDHNGTVNAKLSVIGWMRASRINLALVAVVMAVAHVYQAF